MPGRWIATAAELDALPATAVVRTLDGAGTWVSYLGEHGRRWVGVEYDPVDAGVQVEHKQHWLYDSLPVLLLHPSPPEPRP